MVLSIASRMRLDGCFLLFVVQNEEENETGLPFFKELSHLCTATIAMTVVFGKGVVCTICERKRYGVRGLFLFFASFQKNKRKWL